MKAKPHCLCYIPIMTCFIDTEQRKFLILICSSYLVIMVIDTMVTILIMLGVTLRYFYRF